MLLFLGGLFKKGSSWSGVKTLLKENNDVKFAVLIIAGSLPTAIVGVEILSLRDSFASGAVVDSVTIWGACRLCCRTSGPGGAF